MCAAVVKGIHALGVQENCNEGLSGSVWQKEGHVGFVTGAGQRNRYQGSVVFPISVAFMTVVCSQGHTRRLRDTNKQFNTKFSRLLEDTQRG